jgi:DNA invertase Pin-like site-specific DNA recombinase
MSEAELHVLKARLRGGILNKARRGELQCPLPVGFVYNRKGQVVLDPDRQVQDSIPLLFRTFRRTGSALAADQAKFDDVKVGYDNNSDDVIDDIASSNGFSGTTITPGYDDP